MTTFTGTDADETIRPTDVSGSVSIVGNPLVPSNAVDVIFSGAGNDTVEADGGDDEVNLGSGNDVFIWNAGDGSDLVEGGTGFDELKFIGSTANERITIAVDQGHVFVTRDVDGGSVELSHVERILIDASAGRDVIDVGALFPTPVEKVVIDLDGTTPGVGDGAEDIVNVRGRSCADTVRLSLVNGKVVVNGTSSPEGRAMTG